VWNVSLHNQLSDARNRTIERVAVSGAPGSFVVRSGDSASLVLYRIPEAPSGKTYEAWVIDGGVASPAGLFRGGAGPNFVPITHPVRNGSVVAVTVEPEGGSPQPTQKPFVVSDPV
jgi:anti-sigma-K factor RskA